MPAHAGHRRTRPIGALTAVSLIALAIAAPARAADFNPAPGTYTVDTTAITITGPGTSINGVDEGGVAVFSFDTVNVAAGVTLNAAGTRPLKIIASGSLTIAGLLDGSGGDSVAFAFGNYPGGPGGGAGGLDISQAGAGAGGGGTPSSWDAGGGGGGFGGAGAAGGPDGTGSLGGAGGASYGALAGLLGGSGGSGGSDTGGGGGGGGIALHGASVTIAPSGEVRANGGGGNTGGSGASGAGSGGMIVVHGASVDISGVLSVVGGPGGTGGCCGDGGGGGGGRITLEYQTLSLASPPVVAGGPSGTRSTDGCGSTCPPGLSSPNPTGETGVVLQRAGATATTDPATGVSQTGATLNGKVNANSNATTYYFEYGTSTAYGSRVPATDVPAGAATAPVAFSQTISGLAPGTTYHYRIVATDSLGFTARGADVSFATAPTPPPTSPTSPGAVDNDRDGSPAGQDCDDADPTRRPGLAEIVGNGVDEDCDGRDTPGRVTNTVSAFWFALKKFTRVTTMTVKGAPAGSTITVTCKGRGCPFKRKTLQQPSAGNRKLTGLFNRRTKGSKRRKVAKLRPKTRIEIRVTRPGWIGKINRYTIRAKKPPVSTPLCLPIGSNRPVKTC